MYETPGRRPRESLTLRVRATVPSSPSAKTATTQRARMNRSPLRLADCAGIRVVVTAGLTHDDVRVDSTRPRTRVRPEVAKGDHGRTVPRRWDEVTLAD